MKVSDILFESGKYWVCKIKNDYHCMEIGITHSKTESAYSDLSLAIARAKYLSNRKQS